MRIVLPLVASLITLASTFVLAAEEADVTAIKRLEVSADDLVRTTGLDIYKFEFNLPKDAEFGVVFREWRDKETPPRVIHQFVFRKVDDGPATLRIALLPRERTMRGVLLAEYEDAIYRADVTGCLPGGVTTIVSLPLVGIKQKTLIVHPLHDEKETAKPGEIRLLTVMASEAGKPAPDAASAYPRADLFIQRRN